MDELVPIKVLVTGDRDYKDGKLIWAVLDIYKQLYKGRMYVIEGGAPGADLHAFAWCQLNPKVGHYHYEAEWKKYGKLAGPIRNKNMLAVGPDVVLAFHDNIKKSKGTKHMIKIAKEAGVKVRLFEHGKNF